MTGASAQRTPEGRRTRARVLQSVMGSAARVPFTTTLITVIVVATLVVGGLFGVRQPFLWSLATGLQPLGIYGHWWSPVTSLLVAAGPVSLIVVAVFGGAVLAISERRLGTMRTALAFFGTAIAADVIGIVTQAVVGYAGGMWVESVRSSLVLDPLTGVAGVAMTASAFATARTRRRMRVLTVLVVLMFLLYRGSPDDLYRLLATVLGLLLGIVLSRGRPAIAWGRSSHHEVRVFMASVVAAGAVGPIIAAMSRHPHGLLAPIAMLLDDGSSSDPQGLRACSVYAVSRACVDGITLERIGSVGPIILSLVPLLLLLVVAWGLLRGRRFAVWLGIAMNTVLAVCAGYYLGFLPRAGVAGVERVPGHDSWGIVLALGATAVAPAVTVVLLIATRRRFTVVPARRTVVRYFVIVGGTVVAVVLLYLVLGWMLRDTAFDRPVTFADLLFDAVERFVPVEFLHREVPDFLPTTPVARILYHGVGPVFWITAMIAAIPPLGSRPVATAADAERAGRILRTHGGDHLSFMTTWPLTSYWFGADGETAIGYRVVGSVAITIGAPFGQESATAQAMADFARYCDDRGWTPAFYSVDAGEWEARFAAMGWDRVVVAEEAVIAPQAWSTTGKRWQDVRTAVNRARRDGLSLQWTSWSALPRETASEIADISEQWVAQKSVPELGFTLGGLDELRDPDVALMLVLAADGSVEAVTSWMPGFRDQAVVGWTLDFMRRRVDGPNGVMEFVIAGAAEQARDDGMRYLSLSGAPLARTTGPEAPENTLDGLLALLAASLESMYGFRSLLKFKRKFQPEFRPLLLTYPDPAALPAIGLALLRAYLPEHGMRRALRLLRRQ